MDAILLSFDHHLRLDSLRDPINLVDSGQNHARNFTLCFGEDISLNPIIIDIANTSNTVASDVSLMYLFHSVGKMVFHARFAWVEPHFHNL